MSQDDVPAEPSPGSAGIAVRLRGITKAYPGVVANDSIDLDVEAGSIHGLLGENGAGKSTLMKVLFGVIEPDAGTIDVKGERCRFRSPADALGAGIGMVQQHFSLIDDFTIAENVMLGVEPRRRGFLDVDEAAQQVRDLSERYRFRLDPTQSVRTLAVGAKQRVEILKALHRGAEILILDEPTAALAPQEADELFAVLRELHADGRTVILISHKLPEVIALCDRVTVLRDGQVTSHRDIPDVARVDAGARRLLEAELAHLMVGRDLPTPPVRTQREGPVVLELRGITDGKALGPLDLIVHGGEIVGLAGVEGNGQTELVELLVGVRRCAGGQVLLDGRDLTSSTVGERLHSGIAHIAEDRHAAGVALAMTVAENAALGFHNTSMLSKGALRLSQRRVVRFAEDLVQRYDVRTPSVKVSIAALSGGNQQKLVVGREMARQPRLMVAAQPTRGLDVAASAAVLEELLALREAGCAVLLVSLDLAELLSVVDRAVVLRNGRIAGEALAAEADPSVLGVWMAGAAPERREPAPS